MTAKKLEYFGKVDNQGILKLYDKIGFSEDLKDFHDKEVRLIVELKSKRTEVQNAFYWGNFIPAQIECFKERFGEKYRKQQMHDWNKLNFWGEERLNELTGEMIMMPESSTAQSTTEWEEKLENCRQWFRQNMSWELPYPEKQSKLGLQ